MSTPREYQYLKPRNGQKSVYECEDNIEDKYIFRREDDNMFLVFDDIESVAPYLLPSEDHHYHEVVIENRKQKLRFDIDKELGNGEVDNMEEFCEEIMKQTIVYYLAIFEIRITEGNFIICSSSNKHKLSLHIIVDGVAFPDHKTVHKVAMDIIKELPDHISKYVDKSIYVVNKSLRVVGSCKFDDPSKRIKRIIKCADDNVRSVDSLITYTEYCVEAELVDHASPYEIAVKDIIKTTTLNEEELLKVKEIIQNNGYLNNFSIRVITGSMVIMNRLRSTYCRFCQRNHDNDNTLYFVILRKPVCNDGDNVEVTIDNSHCEIYINEKCRRDKYGSHTIGTFITNLTPRELEYINKKRNEKNDIVHVSKIINDDDKEFIKEYGKSEWILRNEIAYHAQQNNSLTLEISTKYLHDKNVKVISYEDNKLQDFIKCETLLVSAQMKMGKTKALRKFLNDHYSFEGSRIVFLSFRQAFTNNIRSIFEDFVVYSDVSGELNQNRVIVQVESLHRLSVGGSVDLLIMDESESIINQIDSNLAKKQNECLAKFEWLLKYSQSVVCMDAYLTDRTMDVLMNVRKKPIIIQHNTFKNATKDTYLITKYHNRWLNDIYVKLGKKPKNTDDEEVDMDDCDEDTGISKKIAIISSSLSEAETLYELLTTKFPNLTIGFYSSKTLESEKKRVFRDVNNHWNQYDVLIYTPTISAGVSFEVEHYDYVYAYFTNNSCDVQTCMQMLGRIRNVRERTYYICLATIPLMKVTNVKELDKVMEMDMKYLFEDDSRLQRQINRMGYNVIVKNTYYYIWRQNTIMKNRSSASFDYYFLKFITKSGAKVMSLLEYMDECATQKTVDKNIYVNAKAYEKQFKIVKNKIKIEEYEKIAESKDLTDVEYEILRDRKSRQEDITVVEQRQMKKKRLVNIYKFPIETMNMYPEFVATYGKLGEIYSTMRTLKDRNFAEILEESKISERNLYSLYNTLEETTIRSTSYTDYRSMLEILQMLGFKNFYDNEPKDYNEDVMKDVMEYIKKNLSSIKQHYQIYKNKKFTTINNGLTVIEFVKAMLRRFGAKLKVIKNKETETIEQYSLIACEAFVLHPTESIVGKRFKPSLYD